MARTLLAVTSPGEYRAAGSGNLRTIDGWERLDHYLRNTAAFGPEVADLFAEPVQGEDGAIDWYFAGDDEAAPRELAALSPDEQDAARQQARTLVERLRAHAQALQQGRDADGRRLGELLASALSLPSDERNIKVVGGRIVLVNWGMLDQHGGTASNALETFIKARRAPLLVTIRHITTMILDRRLRAWALLWLPFVALLLVAAYLLLAACGTGRLVGFALFDYCPAEPYQAMAPIAEDDEHEALIARLSELNDRFLALPACLPPQERLPEVAALPEDIPMAPPVAEEPPAPDVPEEDEFDSRREEAGGQTGEVTITLIWDSDADLDLHVICPDGSRIFFDQKSGCGGLLDVDANVDSPVPNPAENIYWPEGSAPEGKYRVEVHNYKGRSAGGSPVPFQLQVRIGDQEPQRFEGAVREDDGTGVTEFEMP
jgi:hypothetical protein